MVENTVERSEAVSDLAEHLERKYSACPAGSSALSEWIENLLKDMAHNPVPNSAEALWLIESSYIQWLATFTAK